MSRCCIPARFEKTLGASGARVRINGFPVHTIPQKSCAMRTRDRSCDVPQHCFSATRSMGTEPPAPIWTTDSRELATDSWSGITNENRA